MKKILAAALSVMVGITFSFGMITSSFADVEYTKVKSGAKPGTTVITKIKADGPTVGVLKWKKAKNAKHYEIYCSLSKTGTYKKVDRQRAYTLKTQTWGCAVLNPGQTYYFKVRATNGSKKGKFSKAKSCVAGNVKTIKNLSIWSDVVSGDTRSVCIDFEGVNYGLKVEVYRSTDGENYECIAPDVDGFDWEYTDETAKKGVKYTYKVRAYVTEVNKSLKTVKGGEKFYGEYSNTVTTE